MRTVHRILAAFAVLFALYIASTGVSIQLVDLQALYRHAPADNPTMRGIRVGKDGPPNFQVIQVADYSAASLPVGFDFRRALATVIGSARSALGGKPIDFIEFRMWDGMPAGLVKSGTQLWRFDVLTGKVLGAPSRVPPLPTTLETPGLRTSLKSIHRWGGHWAYIVDVFFGTALCVMIITGATTYFKLFRARVRMGKLNPFWSAGGWWWTLHRAVALCAVIFLTVIALSGTVLAINALGVVTDLALHHGKRPGITGDFSTPLTDSELPAMLGTTIAGYQAAKPGVPIRVLRLRYFAGMSQGVVITGEGEARQLVFNAQTGRPESLTEPGYPNTDLTFGWQVDQTVKSIHRGDYFGLTGRWMDLFAGLSLIYLSLSGAVMYLDRWKKRRKQGRPDFFWSDHKRGRTGTANNVSR